MLSYKISNHCLETIMLTSSQRAMLITLLLLPYVCHGINHFQPRCKNSTTNEHSVGKGSNALASSRTWFWVSKSHAPQSSQLTSAIDASFSPATSLRAFHIRASKRNPERKPAVELGLSPPVPSHPDNIQPIDPMNPELDTTAETLSATLSTKSHNAGASSSSRFYSSHHLAPSTTTCISQSTSTTATSKATGSPPSGPPSAEKIVTSFFQLIFTLLMLLNINITWRIHGEYSPDHCFTHKHSQGATGRHRAE